MKKLNVFLYIFSLQFLTPLHGAQYQLKHMCAYSNESVVKFRDKMLGHAGVTSLEHPGFSFDWPVDLCEFWISSLYGMRRKKMHGGVDMAALKGTEVKAAANGRIESVNYGTSGYGNVVVVAHRGGISTRYAHLNTIAVEVGEKVKKGEVIGTVGATGNVRGADPSHLHFEIITKDGVRIDPLLYLYSAEIKYKNLKK